MKGKIVSITPGSFINKKKETVQKWDVIIDIGNNQNRKYSCFQKAINNYTIGQEIEFNEQKTGTWTDSNGNQQDNWRMELFKERGSQSYGKSPEERKSIERQVCLKEANTLIIETLKLGIEKPKNLDGVHQLFESTFEKFVKIFKNGNESEESTLPDQPTKQLSEWHKTLKILLNKYSTDSESQAKKLLEISTYKRKGVDDFGNEIETTVKGVMKVEDLTETRAKVCCDKLSTYLASVEEIPE